MGVLLADLLGPFFLEGKLVLLFLHLVVANSYKLQDYKINRESLLDIS